jgi:serine/threonine protein phosphatase PrpC
LLLDAEGPVKPGSKIASMLEVEFAHLSDDGKLRDHNEDYVGQYVPTDPDKAGTHGYLFALADGVGGQARGEVAAQAAVTRLVTGFESAPEGEPLPQLMTRLVRESNQHVYETGRAAAPGGVNMATTLVALALRHDRAVVAHAGDSRCYHVRERQAALLTRDHTWVNDQLKLGLISAREAATSEKRHVLSRSLGMDLFVNVDTSEHQVLSGDVFVLCCDGLHGSVEASEIAAVAGAGRDLRSAARILVALANERDGSDNVSVQIIRVKSVERVGMYRGRPYKLR